ncbi:MULTISPECIES: flavin reductase family protein [Streptomyces]|uniref:flavin reductase family protein n=1 Tax=Streptomyces TaxID=1883 RepID=UPI0036CD2772
MPDPARSAAEAAWADALPGHRQRAGPGPSDEGFRFRSVLGQYATGVTIVSAVDPVDGRPCGLVVSSFTSVSINPPLVAFCVSNVSRSWPRMKAAARCCVNVLAADQRPLVDRFFRSGADKFNGVDWWPSMAGSPVIPGVLAWIDCSIESEHPAGDHTVVIARVLDMECGDRDDPLLFFRSSYGSFRAL